MASGGIRHDFTAADNINRGEHRPFRIPVEDENGDPVTSFAGWEVEFYLLAAIGDERADALLTKLDVDFTKIVPNAFFDFSDDDWDSISVQPYAYRFWRVDAGHEVQLASGDFIVSG